MAEYRGKMAESGETTSTASSGVRGGGGGDLIEGALWEHALLAACEEGSASITFRLPELSQFAPSHVAHTANQIRLYQAPGDAQLEPWQIFANSPGEMTDHSVLDLLAFTGGFDTASNSPFGDPPGVISTYNRRAILNPTDHHSFSWITNTDVVVPGSLPLTQLVSSDTHMADATAQQAPPPRQLVPGNAYYSDQMPVLAPGAQEMIYKDGTVRNGRPLMPPPSASEQANSPSSVSAWAPRLPAACPHRRRVDPEMGRFVIKPTPEINYTTSESPNQALVPHTSCVAMPAIGSVGAFMRTPESFLDLPPVPAHKGADLPNAGDPLHFQVPPPRPQLPPLLPQPPSQTSNPVIDLSAPHRYPRFTKPRASRTPAASRTSSKQNKNQPQPHRIWHPTRAVGDEAATAASIHGSGQLGQGRFNRVSDPMQAQNLPWSQTSDRPSTRGVTFLPAGIGPDPQLPPPPHLHIPTLPVGLTINTTEFRNQRPRRELATDPQSLYARQRDESDLADGINAQDMYLKERKRDRINERLHILQQLIPNGNEIKSLTHMLEEASLYIKSLERQVLELVHSDNEWVISAAPKV